MKIGDIVKFKDGVEEWVIKRGISGFVDISRGHVNVYMVSVKDLTVVRTSEPQRLWVFMTEDGYPVEIMQSAIKPSGVPPMAATFGNWIEVVAKESTPA